MLVGITYTCASFLVCGVCLALIWHIVLFCLYIYMYYMVLCMYVCTYVCVRCFLCIRGVQRYTHKHERHQRYIYQRLHIYMHSCRHTNVHNLMHITHAHTHTHSHVQTYTHTGKYRHERIVHECARLSTASRTGRLHGA